MIALAFERHLPDQCSPTTPFLAELSSLLHTCIPTPLAFVSTLLGTLSILSWLFAQLPQIIRNYKNQSTAGLSLFFLIEWNLGDITNLCGAVLTNQATWQVIVGAYYCFVDISLVLQWIWYERLKHGKPLKWIRFAKTRSRSREVDDDSSDQRLAPSDSESAVQFGLAAGEEMVVTRRDSTSPQDIPSSKAAHASDMFSTPVYGTLSPPTSLARSPTNRTIHRIQQQGLPSSTPRAVLFVTLLLAIASIHASPTFKRDTSQTHPTPGSAGFSLGTIMSWTSTLLYLLSRLPQLFLNFRRKSTSGLSPTLFAAAFCGNLFYSSSLALNPCAWQSFGPNSGNGWAGPSGSDQREWITAALPFFLGAAGVLGLDGAVGLQFWQYGIGRHGQDEEVLIIQETSGPGVEERSMRVRRVSGWMRGWQPSASGRISPVLRVRTANDDEEEALLDRRRPGSVYGSGT